MKLLKEFERVCSEIREHVGYDGYIENYQISTSDVDYFWQSCGDDEISWAESKEDILEDAGNVYNAEHKGIFRGDEITLALVKPDFNSEYYWLFLDSKNEIK